MTPTSLTGLRAGATGEPLPRARGGPRPTEKLAGSSSPQASDHSLSRAGTRAAARSCQAPVPTTSPKLRPATPAPVPVPVPVPARGRQGAPEAAPLARRPNRWGRKTFFSSHFPSTFTAVSFPFAFLNSASSITLKGWFLPKFQHWSFFLLYLSHSFDCTFWLMTQSSLLCFLINLFALYMLPLTHPTET